MKSLKMMAIALLALCYLPNALAQSPDGTWTTMDDKTGKKRAVVRLETVNGVLTGTIIRTYKEPGDTGICTNCPGDFKDKPIQGLQFLWGLQDKGNGVWDGGQILDPKSGKIYRAKMTVKANKIYMRGYVGLSMLGRTQVWVR